MALKTITAKLNGGDAITANNKLTFNIYSESDAYATPIHSSGSAIGDPNVTIKDDDVTIKDIEAGTEEVFKISPIDEAGNEGELSDAVGSVEYGLHMLEGDAITIPKSAGIGSTVVLNMKLGVSYSSSNGNNYLYSNGASQTANGWIGIYVDLYGRPILKVYDSAGLKETAVGAPGLTTTDANIEIRIISSTLVEFWYRDLLAESLAVVGLSVSSTTTVLNAFNNTGTLGIDSNIGSFSIDGETFLCNEGSGTTVTGGEGTIGTFVGTPTWYELP